MFTTVQHELVNQVGAEYNIHVAAIDLVRDSNVEQILAQLQSIEGTTTVDVANMHAQ